MSAADVSTYMAAATTAISAEEWSTAYTKLLSAKAALVALPDSERDGSKIQWDREAIDKLIVEVKEQKAAAASASNTPNGFRRLEVQYADPTD